MTRALSYGLVLVVGVACGFLLAESLPRQDAEAEKVVREVGLYRTPVEFDVLYADDNWKVLATDGTTVDGITLLGPDNFAISTYENVGNRTIILSNRQLWWDGGMRLVDYGRDSIFEVVSWNDVELPVPRRD